MSANKLARRLYYRAWSLMPREKLSPSKKPIDIVIPIVPKDLAVLPLCLEGIEHCVKHTVEAVYVVSPHDDEVIRFCTEKGLTFVDENDVLGFAARDLNLIAGPQGTDRSGWLFQQLIKLSGKIGTCDHYLCIDADHVLLRPHVFVTDDGRTVLYKSSEYHPPYLESVKRLTGLRRFSFLSYVTHKMCFDRSEVVRLQKLIEQRAGGKPWTEAIVDSYDRCEVSGFSEFQLYGHFAKHKTERPWLNHALGKGKLAQYDELVKRYGRFLNAVTFPDYKK